jgi:N-acetylglutamate synthase-like GNAT family acetyltransferase
MLIRTACHDDLSRVQAIADTAYRMYLPRMDQKPAPILADFSRHIDKDVVFVAVDTVVLGYAVLCARDDGWLLDNIAVDPRGRGRASGWRLFSDVKSFYGKPVCAITSFIPMSS